jgi:hypothetical protein
MRLSDDRYSRDLRRFSLALRMLTHEARPNTICAWTGFTAERVRHLCRSHRKDVPDGAGPRHRGPSPTKLTPLLASPSLRSEVAAIAGLCRVLGVIPAAPLSSARQRLPSVANGERLCDALELFREIVPHARLTLEQLVLVVFVLSEGEQWGIDHCTKCRAIILVDHLSLARRVCAHCREEPDTAGDPGPVGQVQPGAGNGRDGAGTAVQQSLF